MKHIIEVLHELGPDPNPEKDEDNGDDNWEDVEETDDEEETMESWWFKKMQSLENYIYWNRFLGMLDSGNWVHNFDVKFIAGTILWLELTSFQYLESDASKWNFGAPVTAYIAYINDYKAKPKLRRSNVVLKVNNRVAVKIKVITAW